jgi:hypothetical protein
MPTYIITYEINDKSRLDKFETELKANFSSYCPIHNNAWAVVTEKPAKEIRDKLSTYITGSDRIFVIRSGTEAAWRNSYGEKHNEWLKKYL